MRGIKRSKSERMADLVRGYGSIAETGRKLSKVMGVKDSTAAKYISSMLRGERPIERDLWRSVNRRLYYAEVERPRIQISRLSGVDEKIDFAMSTARKEISLEEIIPEGTAFFGFDFQQLVDRDPRFRYVREAIKKGVKIRVAAVVETEDGRKVIRRGVIGGMDRVGKKNTRKYIAQMYHLLREAYNSTGTMSWIVAGSGVLGDE